MPHEIVDLRKVDVRDLAPVLAEEVAEWRRELLWDFAPTAELVKQYAATGSLAGAALVSDGAVQGYGYAVLEDQRGIVGDLFVAAKHRTPEIEAQIFDVIVQAATAAGRVRRVESQLMLAGPATALAIRRAAATRGGSLRAFERAFMITGHLRGDAQPTATPTGFRIVPWEKRFLQPAGEIIAGSYQGRIDAEINAQYRSAATARQFLCNIVDFPGCGRFDPKSSFVAWSDGDSAPKGLVLSTFVAERSGHIAQLCVLPDARGRNLGSSLLSAAVTSMAAQGADVASLTVTEGNPDAFRLYRKSGFTEARRFYAYVQDAD